MPNPSSEHPSQPLPTHEAQGRAKLLQRLGIFLILLSGVFFFSMLSVPWWPLEISSKAIAGGVLFVGVQLAWWVGAALLGPAALRMMKSWFTSKTPVVDKDV